MAARMFTASWKPPKLWDINTPENQYAAEVSLLDAGGRVGGHRDAGSVRVPGVLDRGP